LDVSIIPDAKTEPDIHVGLKGRKYLLRAFEHANKFHKQKNSTTAKGKKNVFFAIKI